jgi:hypothetical protein
MAQQTSDSKEIEQLRRANVELMGEVDRYRTAMEDALQQLDWCIGYFTALKNRAVARSLSANRSYIRRNILKQAEQSLPTDRQE